jgi:hypothetical protein
VVRGPGLVTSWFRAGPVECPGRICSSGDAGASHLGKPNRFMVRTAAESVSRRTEPPKAMRCHARMALVVFPGNTCLSGIDRAAKADLR